MTGLRRDLYRHKDLTRLFNPRSIAVVGASPNEMSLGWRTAWHLEKFEGPLFLVNPKYERIGEAPCYPSIASLPQTPDCVVITTPRDAVEEAVSQCADRGVGGAVIYAAGYAETGRPERVAQQNRLADIARESGLKILGPNCLGFVNFPHNVRVSFSRGELKAEGGHSGVGIVSQSGAVGFALFQGARRGVAMSHVIASGNSCNLDIADDIAYLAEEPECRAIICVLEGLSDPSRMIEAGEIAWAADKPLIVCKLGTGEQGAAAALSHSGSLAGSLDAYRAAFERAGIIMLNDLDLLVEAGAFFAKAPRRPATHGVGIVAISGGSAVSSTDKAEIHGVPMPQPAEQTRQALLAQIPEFGSARNPCDVTAMAGNRPDILYGACETMAADPQYGVIVAPFTSVSADTGQRLKTMAASCARHGKLLCVPWISNWLEGPGSREAETDANIALFHSVDHCFSSLAAWQKRDAMRRDREAHGPRKLARLSPPDAGEKAAKLLAASRNKVLTESEAKAVLACYGVPVVGESLARSPAEAAAAAQAMGYPVALKVESPDLPHKTEAGVIRLNLRTADEVKSAFEAVMANAARYKVDAHINGVLVQPMVPAGAEIMVGARIDPLFGPMIVAGLGGVFVELMKDTAVDLAPITQQEAEAMLGRLKGKAMLAGFRGAEPVDRAALAAVLVRLGELVAEQRERIAELDVNPLICADTRIVAVDALIVRA
jgi:acyl-CoA synthetase (NDP forming)